MSELNWHDVSEEFLAEHPGEGAWRPLVEALRNDAPGDITVRLPAVASEEDRARAREFLLLAVRRAVADHALTEQEVTALRQVTRILRIEEGDLLSHHRRDIQDLLCTELQRLLEDRAIDATEATHKVKLQEVLGLGYDQFVTLTSPVIEGVVRGLVRQLDVDAGEGPMEEDVQWLRARLAALDTVYDVHPRSLISAAGGGYLYLLVNPSMPGLLKIGRTSRAPDERVAELTGATGVPTPFILVYHLSVLDAEAAELYVHRRLEERGLRVSENREFFMGPTSEAIELIREARDAVSSL